MPAPSLSDSSNNLLAKILRNLGGTPSVGDGKLNLLRKIAEAYGATTNRADSPWVLLNRIVSTGANKPSVSDSEYNLLYKFALNTGVTPLRGDSKYNLLFRICQQTVPPVYDEDAVAFAETSGATDIANLSAFVTGVKDLGLWDSMVCWPLRSAQNAGTGTTAYSLGGLGTYNGTLVNGPTWGADGVDFSQNSSEHILTALTPQNNVDQFIFAAFECNAQGTGSNFNVVASSRNAISPSGGWTAAQEWTGGFGTLLWADSGSLNLLGINQIIDGSYNTALFRYSIASSPQTLGVTVNSLSEQTVTGAKSQGNSSPILLGNEGPVATRSLGGNLSFAAYIQSSSVNNAAIRDLYKSTLGQGLGLP